MGVLIRLVMCYVIRSFEKSQSQKARMKNKSTKPKRRRRRMGMRLDREVEVPRIPRKTRKLSNYCPLKKPITPALKRHGSSSSLKSVRWDRKKEELTYLVF